MELGRRHYTECACQHLQACSTSLIDEPPPLGTRVRLTAPQVVGVSESCA
jgi:hypothetical protein